VRARQFWRYCWVAPISVWFLPLAWLAKWTGGGYAVHTGVLEIWGGKVGRRLERGIPLLGAVDAFTLGHLVVGVSPEHLELSRVHERTHVAQFERWGALFPVMYAAAGLWTKACGKDGYWDNPYEIEARANATLQRELKD